MKLSGKIARPETFVKRRHLLTSLILVSISSGKSHKLALGQNILYKNIIHCKFSVLLSVSQTFFFLHPLISLLF